MSRLAIQNIHQRDSSISFEESSHTYTVKGIRKGYTSVTKLLHCFFPDFNPDEVIRKMRLSKSWPQSQYFGMTDYAIKKKWKDEGFASSRAGTNLHLRIEKFLDGESESVEAPPTPEWNYFQNFWERTSPELEPYRLEWPVWVEELKLAGCIDCVFKRKGDGAFFIYDWKRSKEIKKKNDFENGLGPLSHLPASNYWQYTIQLNIYKWILERYYGLVIEGLYLVILHPDNKSYIRMELNKMDSEVEDIMEARRKRIVSESESDSSALVIMEEEEQGEQGKEEGCLIHLE